MGTRDTPPKLTRLGRGMAVLVAASLNPEHGMHYHRGQLTREALCGLAELVAAGWLRADHRGRVFYWEVVDMPAIRQVAAAEAEAGRIPDFAVLAMPNILGSE
jgi:hypothetical protein